MSASSAHTYRYIDSAASLMETVSALSNVDRVALDIEANSLHHYFQKVCLLQMSAEGEHYIVDPLCGVDLRPLLDMLSGKRLIFHAGDYDLRMLRMSFEFSPKAPVFDTMLAAQLIGCDELGLVAVAQRFLDVPLTKHSQKSNWARRPLSEQQLGYASDDTRYLETLADRMADALKEKDRLLWHTEACRRMVEGTARDSDKDADEAWRVKGAGLLKPEELLYLRQFWIWRDKEARRSDVPPFKVVGNAVLLDLAKWAARNHESPLSEAPELPRSVKGRRFNVLDAALTKAREVRPGQWPQHKKRNEREPVGEEFRKRLSDLQDGCAAVAEELRISPSVLASRATLTDIARHEPTSAEAMVACSAMMRWQAELLESRVAGIFNGTNHRDGLTARE